MSRSGLPSRIYSWIEPSRAGAAGGGFALRQRPTDLLNLIEPVTVPI